MPLLLLEVQYMMELLEPSWLTGEGGYYLTSAFASLCLIQSHPQAPPSGGMTSEAQEKLREWSRRRGQENITHAPSNQNQRLVRVLYQEGTQSVVRTLQWVDGEPASSLALSCATAFAVGQPQYYGLFCRAAGGEMKPLPPHALIHETHGHSVGSLPSLSYLRVDHDTGKVRRLTRGGAVDLGGSVCEE
ncbi:ras and Rab interactor 1-like [Sardina pilchardus]|uniref:ras and Rab interactor 1-like n=1 Tax=Sardina pilchardus TaxID=27697 RepID=UPI002E10EF08